MMKELKETMGKLIEETVRGCLTLIPVCCFLSLKSPLFLISSCQERVEWHPASRTEIKRWNECTGFPSLAFPYGESDYL